MKTEMEQSTQTPEEVLQELRSLVSEAEQILKQSAGENDEPRLAALRQRFEAAQERLTEFYEEARRRVVAGAQYTDQTIRDNPYQSLAVAVGVGVIAGLVLSRLRTSPVD